jgi:hypothetical protein
VPHPPRDTPEVVSLYVGCRRDQELEGARNTRFRQVWAAESIMSYVVCIILGGDRVISCLEGVPVRPYIARRIGLHGSLSWVQAQESYPNTSRIISYRVRLVSLLYG